MGMNQPTPPAEREPLNWNHPEFYPCQCPKCGWQGMSNETAGGNQIADTGDYNDPVCPVCIAPGGDYEIGQWITVEDAPKPAERETPSYDALKASEQHLFRKTVDLERQLAEARLALKNGGVLELIDRAAHERAKAINERDAAMEQRDRLAEALRKIQRRTVIAGSVDEYRRGQLDALSACSEVASTALATLDRKEPE